MKIQKIVKGFFWVLLILMLGGLGGVILNNYILPHAIALNWVSERGLFDATAERTTVIEKTEEIIVQEDDSVERTIAQPSTTTATLIYPKRTTGRVTAEELVLPGVLVTNDGVIATYREDGASLPTPRAIFNNGDRHEVDFLGYDSFTNLLFYKVKKDTNTPSIIFANSNDTRTGKKLVILKNGLLKNESSLEYAIMAGRNFTFNLNGPEATSEKWEGVFDVTNGVTADFIGAPVVQYNGEMIGILGNKTTEAGETLFVLPANVVRQALTKVSAKSLPTQAHLGVAYVSLTPENQTQNNLALDKGALVTELLARPLQAGEKYAAKKIDLQVGDVITKINGQEVIPQIPLSTLIYAKQVGEETKITLIRDGKEVEITTNFQ